MYPYVALVICSEKELCYYGNDAAEVRKRIFPEGRDGLYSGGGEDGYWGVEAKEKEIEAVLEKVKSYWKVYSYHIFYFRSNGILRMPVISFLRTGMMWTVLRRYRGRRYGDGPE